MTTYNIRPGSSNLQSPFPATPTPQKNSALSPLSAPAGLPASPFSAADQRSGQAPPPPSPPDFVGEFLKNLGAAGRTALAALKRAGTTLTGLSFDEFTTLNPPHPPQEKYPSAKDQQDASRFLEFNESREAQALAGLSPLQRAAYQTVRSQLGENPAALRALQQTLLDNRLTGEPLAKDGKSLLDQLQAMSQQPLADGIDRQTWLTETLIEIHKPERVSQHAWNTCGPTTAQILLLRKNPAEYARLQSGLASPEGKVTMMGGGLLEREANWNVGVSPHNNATDQRTTSAKLFQSAVMEVGNGFGFIDYDAATDIHKPTLNFFGLEISSPIGAPGLPGGIPGLPSVGMENILKQLTGQSYDNRTPLPWQRDDAWKDVEKALADGRGPVSTVLLWDGAMPHYVQIDRVANERVYFTNPWGVEQSLSKREFYDHLMQVQIQQN